MDCLFCKIIQKEIEAKIVYEDNEVLAFEDIAPKAPQHILIIPKKHIPTLNDANETDQAVLGQIMLTAAKIAKKLGIAEPGYRVLMNCNKGGGGKWFFTFICIYLAVDK